MANTGNHQIKILELMRIFEQETDEDHALTINTLVEMIQGLGYSAERKGIRADIEILRDFGMDIERTHDRAPGYYLASREFELPELKLLADAVAASRFITEKKSEQLLDKLTSLTSVSNAAQLNRQVVVRDRLKAEKDGGYYTIDTIYNCINNNHQMTFQYQDWVLKGAQKKLVLRHGGSLYEVSPCALFWDDEKYYLVAFSQKNQAIRHYRVDKIVHAEEVDMARDQEGMRLWDKTDKSNYTRRTFGMFAGKPEIVGLQAAKRLTGVLIDRFGTDISMRAVNDDTIAVRVPVELSGQFYGWLAGLGSDIKITSPAAVAEDYAQYLKHILQRYSPDK